MADRLIEYLAHRHAKVKPEAFESSGIAKNKFETSESALLQHPKPLPNPLRQVRRRPAHLNLAGATGSSARPGPSSAKSFNTMTIQQKLLLGVTKDLARLQKNPATFDRIFPPSDVAAAQKRKPKLAQEWTEKLVSTMSYEDKRDEDEFDVREFQKKMRSVWVQT